jgi:capsular polysaccharide biosynthesis protein
MENEKQFDDEIDLMDYVKVIIKRKKTIFFCFFLFVLVAGIASFFILPEIYEVSTSIEIGRLEKKIDGKEEELTEEPSILVSKIKEDIYGIQVRKDLGLPENEYPEIKVENPEDTPLVKMIIKSSEKERAKIILEKTNEMIIEDHQKIEKVTRDLIKEDILNKENKISSIEEEISIVKNKIQPLRSDIERLNNKIESTEEEKEALEDKVASLEQQLIYDQTPGTQYAFFNAKQELANKENEIENLYLRINSSQINIENYNSQINSLEDEIKDYNFQIVSLNSSLEEIRPTKIIKSPVISENSVGPRKMLNLAIAGILGIFIGTFWAFGKEWWENSKENI